MIISGSSTGFALSACKQKQEKSKVGLNNSLASNNTTLNLKQLEIKESAMPDPMSFLAMKAVKHNIKVSELSFEGLSKKEKESLACISDPTVIINLKGPQPMKDPRVVELLKTVQTNPNCIYEYAEVNPKAYDILMDISKALIEQKIKMMEKQGASKQQIADYRLLQKASMIQQGNNNVKFTEQEARRLAELQEMINKQLNQNINKLLG